MHNCTQDSLSPLSSGLPPWAFSPGNCQSAVIHGCHSPVALFAPHGLSEESIGQSKGWIYVSSHAEDFPVDESFCSLQPDTALNLCCQTSLRPRFARTIKGEGRRRGDLEMECEIR